MHEHGAHANGPTSRQITPQGGGEDTSFVPPVEIGRPVAHVAPEIAANGRLRALTREDLIEGVTYLYDQVNFAHRFREGNGRTQREVFAQPLDESGRGFAWDRIEMTDLHAACHRARTAGTPPRCRLSSARC